MALRQWDGGKGWRETVDTHLKSGGGMEHKDSRRPTPYVWPQGGPAKLIAGGFLLLLLLTAVLALLVVVYGISEMWSKLF